jgi:hypothetical protein
MYPSSDIEIEKTTLLMTFSLPATGSVYRPTPTRRANGRRIDIATARMMLLARLAGEVLRKVGVEAT